MDEIRDQLRSFGEATEAAVPPVSAGQIVEPNSAQIIDLDAQPSVAPAPRVSRARRRMVFAAAAALVAIAAASVVFVDRQNEPATLDTASAVQTDLGEPFAVPTDDNGWQKLRFCESTETYNIDTGNTFYGAYQFTRKTFSLTAEQLGLEDYVGTNPADAPPEIQDAVANQIYLERGRDPWPICGRHIDGPMITPVVPRWVGQHRSAAYPVIVFINPEASQDRVDEIDAELRDIFANRIESTMTFVDKETAFAEYQDMALFESSNGDQVTVDDMPPSFRIGRELTPIILQRVRDIDDIFEVITVDQQFTFSEPPPMKLDIPALGLQTPVFQSASLEHLARGPAVLGGNVMTPVIAGYGSVEGSVFARLDELRTGDIITLTLLINEPGTTSEVVRTYEVDIIDVDHVPKPRALDTLADFDTMSFSGLTLVSDVPGDPTQRLMIQTRHGTPELAGYGLGATD